MHPPFLGKSSALQQGQNLSGEVTDLTTVTLPPSLLHWMRLWISAQGQIQEQVAKLWPNYNNLGQYLAAGAIAFSEILQKPVLTGTANGE